MKTWEYQSTPISFPIRRNALRNVTWELVNISPLRVGEWVVFRMLIIQLLSVTSGVGFLEALIPRWF